MAEIIDIKSLDFILDEEEESLDFEIGEFTQVLPDEYPGPYDVIPKVNAQQLQTQSKLMRENVTVWGIPYEEVSNLYGTTVNIAEE